MIYSDSLPPRLLGTAPVAGVVAGAPGKPSPWNARRPAGLAALQAAGALGQVAAWTPGQYLELRDGTRAHWDGDSWAAGAAPAPVGLEGPDTGDEVAAVVTADGVEHVGILPLSASTVPDGTVLEASAPDEKGRVLEVDPDSPVPGVLEQTEADVPDVALPDWLHVTAGSPGDYSPALKASDRPRNVTELRKRAQPVAPFPWLPGQYVLVGENGKRAHWDGTTWQRGEAPTVPDGTVP